MINKQFIASHFLSFSPYSVIWDDSEPNIYIKYKSVKKTCVGDKIKQEDSGECLTNVVQRFQAD